MKKMLYDNLQNVEEKILAACERTGRDCSEVTLISVSKTKPVEMLEIIYEYNQRYFGENKVQELCQKEEVLPKDIKWHMIGHLQKNKVKYIADFVDCIHSVESLSLAQTINNEAAKRDRVIRILVEVNVAEEESKFGLKINQVEEFIRQISIFTNIKVDGLMTVAPYVQDSEQNRSIFSDLRKLLVDINNKNIDNVNMTVLSMGMSNDYEVAIEEGATMIRVGTGIFGERKYDI